MEVKWVNWKVDQPDPDYKGDLLLYAKIDTKEYLSAGWFKGEVLVDNGTLPVDYEWSHWAYINLLDTVKGP